VRRPLLLALALLTSRPAPAAECVVLLHGLGRSPWSMFLMQTALQRAGYAVWNDGYPSTRKTIEALAPVVGEAVAWCRERGASRIHFVTHSMGGILVRDYFQDHRVPEAGRVVMLAPPNHGSEIVDAYGGHWWFRAATGPAGLELATHGLPSRLAPIPLEIGVIAGSRNVYPLFRGVFRGANDGKVSVDSAALAEMKQMLVVDSGHTFMPSSPAVIAQVKAFLRDGAFSGAPAAVPGATAAAP
jgi:triacylglycerol lipase